MENYHVSETFKVLTIPKFNIFLKFNSSEFRLLRKRIIECIISTDMAHHSKSVTALKNKICLAQVSDGIIVEKMIEDADNIKIFDNQQLILNNILHAADISNPTKLTPIYIKWVDLVFTEFFLQGDIEKKENLPISLLCDRSTTDINKAQVGFMKFVVKPSFECLTLMAPEIKTYLDYLNRNLKYFEDQVKFSEEKNHNH